MTQEQNRCPECGATANYSFGCLNEIHYRTRPQAAAAEVQRYYPCGCVLCVCEDEERCHGCGAKHCGTHPICELEGVTPASGEAAAEVDTVAFRAYHGSRILVEGEEMPDVNPLDGYPKLRNLISRAASAETSEEYYAREDVCIVEANRYVEAGKRTAAAQAREEAIRECAEIAERFAESMGKLADEAQPYGKAVEDAYSNKGIAAVQIEARIRALSQLSTPTPKPDTKEGGE